MASDLPETVLIDVPVSQLPSALRARLVPGAVIAGSDRFRPARRPTVLWPTLWICALLVVGIASLVATLRTGFDPLAGASRFVYAGLTGALLLGAAFASRTLVHAWRQRRGSSRLGCHIVARAGVLIADRSGCTWVPRGFLPAPVDDPSTDTRFGGGGVLFILTDGSGGLKRWSAPRRVGSEVDLWRREGVMPDWLDYQP